MPEAGERALKRICRIIFLATAASFLIEALPIRASDQPVESVAMLARARKLEELRADSSVPLLLRAQVKSSFDKTEVPGQYELTWWEPNHWRERVILGEFQRFREGVIGGYRQVRRWEYQPRVIFDLDQILDVASLLGIGPQETVKKARTLKIKGAAFSCVEIDLKGEAVRQLCFDPETGLLVHAELESLSRLAVVDYAGVIALADKKFPAKVRIKRGNAFWMEVSIGSLEQLSGKLDAAPFVDAQDSEFWQSCKDSISPELKNKVQPEFPRVARSQYEQGVVSLYLRIEADGTVSHLKTLQSPSSSLEHASKEAVQHWTFKPASCNGTPVRSETVTDIRFWYPQ